MQISTIVWGRISSAREICMNFLARIAECGELDAPLPRERHDIFVKVYSADRRGELRSPVEFSKLELKVISYLPSLRTIIK